MLNFSNLHSTFLRNCVKMLYVSEGNIFRVCVCLIYKKKTTFQIATSLYASKQCHVAIFGRQYNERNTIHNIPLLSTRRTKINYR